MIKNTRLSGLNWSQGDVLLSLDINETFDSLYNYNKDLCYGTFFKNATNLTAPIGGIIGWHKHYNLVTDGQITSLSTNVITDSLADFTGVLPYSIIELTQMYDAAEYLNTGSTYALTKTFQINPDNTNGYFIDYCYNEIRYSGSTSSPYCYYRFYYTDNTTADSAIQQGSSSYVARTYTNPQPDKKVWKAEIYQRTSSASGTCHTRYNKITFFKSSSYITDVISSTQLETATGTILNNELYYEIYKTPYLKSEWAECNGQVISDVTSPLNGTTLPNLNGYTDATKRFLVGHTTYGTIGGAATHTHTMAAGSGRGSSSSGTGPRALSTNVTDAQSNIPTSMDVVWIMRIK